MLTSKFLVCVFVFVCLPCVNAGGNNEIRTACEAQAPRGDTNAKFNTGCEYASTTSTVLHCTSKCDAANDWVTIVGGTAKKNATLDDAVTSSLLSSTWLAVPATSARSGHSAVAWYNELGHPMMIVFGGQGCKETTLNDVIAFNLVTSTWVAVATTGAPPSSRAFHSAVQWINPDGVQQMTTFGGLHRYSNSSIKQTTQSHSHGYYNSYIGKTDNTERNTVTSSHEHISITVEQLNNDVATLILPSTHGYGTWLSVPAMGTPPAPRSKHSAIHWINAANGTPMMTIFGGTRDATDSGKLLHNDVATFNLLTSTWIPVSVAGTAPSPRRGHSAVQWTNANAEPMMTVFGGRPKDNDVYTFNLITSTWSSVSASGTAPSARAFHTAISHVNGKDEPIMTISGGADAKGRSVGGSGSHDFNLFTNSWVAVANSGTAPLARSSHSAVAWNNKQASATCASGCAMYHQVGGETAAKKEAAAKKKVADAAAKKEAAAKKKAADAAAKKEAAKKKKTMRVIGTIILTLVVLVATSFAIMKKGAAPRTASGGGGEQQGGSQHSHAQVTPSVTTDVPRQTIPTTTGLPIAEAAPSAAATPDTTSATPLGIHAAMTTITIPADIVAGEIFVIQPPTGDQMKLECPSWARGGDRVVVSPSGELVQLPETTER